MGEELETESLSHWPPEETHFSWWRNFSHVQGVSVSGACLEHLPSIYPASGTAVGVAAGCTWLLAFGTVS